MTQTFSARTLALFDGAAALAISAVAVLMLRCLHSRQSPQLGSCATLWWLGPSQVRYW